MIKVILKVTKAHLFKGVVGLKLKKGGFINKWYGGIFTQDLLLINKMINRIRFPVNK